MQRTQSPSLRPSDNGACRWQHLLSSATTFPTEVRKKRIECPSSVRGNSASAPTSCDQAATYHTLRRNFSVFTRHHRSVIRARPGSSRQSGGEGFQFQPEARIGEGTFDL